MFTVGSQATRSQIVEAADDLFYKRGFESTSFADIADVVKISRGNFYYHFKTKDDILDAVIERRIASTRTMLEQWEAEEDSPSARICAFIRILITNRTAIMLYGCPVGTLCEELAKLDHAGQAGAVKIMDLFRVWLRGQFEQLGCGKDADEFALRVLGWSQGAATLSAAFRDEAFIRRDVARMCAWVDQVAGKGD